MDRHFPMSTLSLPDVTTHGQISLAFPFVFVYCKRSMTGGGNTWEQGYNRSLLRYPWSESTNTLEA